MLSLIESYEPDDTVVVRGLDFQDGLTSLSITGCPGLFDRVAEPVTTYVPMQSP